jgi:pimeloyl-ACP methyl ester carboxylesterase
MMLKTIGSTPDGRTKTVHQLRRIAGLLLAIPALYSSCALPRATTVPVPTITYAKRPEARVETLLILLPGIKSRSGDFDRKRFIDMARERGVDADLIEADLHLGYYLDGTCSRRLWEDIVAPARASGYRRIWIVGISLGGSGAIGFAREHGDSLAGLVLLSPYLGPPEMAARIRSVGGLEKWTPENSGATGSFQRFIEENWGFLKRVSVTGGGSPALYLGYGRNEPMGPSLDLLADSLPADHVIRVPGGHRWNTWQALWEEILSRHLFDEPKENPA